MSAHDPAGQLDLEILSAEVALFLAQVPVAEGIGVKLSRLLFGFLQTEVLPMRVGQPSKVSTQRRCLSWSTMSCACTPMPSSAHSLPGTRRCPGYRASRPAHCDG
jgi:hypothetical protein